MTRDAALRAVSPAAATSLQRTYRYLRIGIAGTVVVVTIAVLLAVGDVGLLASISAYYYTPAQNMIVGALVAAALGLFALSGRGVENTLLDVAALLAPLIAIIPTPFAPGRTDGLPYACDTEAPCTPASVQPDIDNGTATYLIAGAAALAVAIVIDAVARRRDAAPPVAWPTLVAAAGILLLVWAAWSFARPLYLALGHDVATVAFFLVLAVVALLNATRKDAGEQAPSPAFRVVYAAIAVVIVVDLIAIAVFLAGGGAEVTDLPVVLVGELLALLAFGVFWVLQTIQKWEQPNPSLRAH